MNIVLRAKELPYLLTVLIGLAVFQVNYLVSALNDKSGSATVAFYFETVESSNTNSVKSEKLECHFVNLSRTKALKDLVIHIRFRNDLPDPKKVHSPNIIPIAPSPIIPDSLFRNAFGLLNEYNIPILHPSSKYVFVLKTEVNSLIQENPKLYVKSSDGFRLIEYGVEAFLVQYQIIVNMAILLIWLCFIIIYVFKINGKKNVKVDSN